MSAGELIISEVALWRGRDAYYNVDTSTLSVDGVTAAIRAAAPIIVADELRRLMGEDECRCHRCIRDRIDELDPPKGERDV